MMLRMYKLNITIVSPLLSLTLHGGPELLWCSWLFSVVPYQHNQNHLFLSLPAVHCEGLTSLGDKFLETGVVGKKMIYSFTCPGFPIGVLKL